MLLKVAISSKSLFEFSMTKLIPKIQTFKGIPFGSVQEFLTTVYKKDVQYALPANSTQTFHTSAGSLVKVNENTFTDTRQYPINEKIHLQIRACQTRKDLLFSEFNLSYSGYYIDAHRLIDIQLKTPSAVGIRLNKAIELEIPVNDISKPQQLQIFKQGPSSTTGLHQSNSLEWKPTSTPLFIQKGPGGKKIAKVQLQQFGPVLIGKKIKMGRNPSKKAMFSVEIQPSIYRFGDIKAFLLFDKYNTVVELKRNRNRFSGFNLPAGQRVNLLILGLHEGKFYFHKSQISALRNQIINVQLKQLPYLKFVQRLQNMIC